ncbi:MAG: serine hydrolase [Phycisphaeraceae bacterium]|nr:MAG: serine hydrolase [Phycisphaeraceae bacterium]
MMAWIFKIVVAVVALIVIGWAAKAAAFALRRDPARHVVIATDQPPEGVRLLDDLLEPIRARNKVPALAAAVLTSRGLEAAGAVGTRAAESDVRVSIDDHWHIGSNTKAMTALLCAILVEQGRLRWETTLAEAFPDLADEMHEDFRRVTVEQLCTNRGGFPADLNQDGLWERLWSHRGAPVEARRLMLREVARKPPQAAPGTRFIYSNAGFAVAGHVCESIAGKPYEELMTELVFKPLGMTSAAFGAPGTPGTLDQPRGHDRRGRPQEPTADGRGGDNPPVLSPAGRLHLSLADWARYVTVHLRGFAGEAVSIGDVTLRPETLRRLHTPADGEYAMGWVRAQRDWAGPADHRWVLTHAGSNTLWYAVVWVAPARDLAVLVCCNQAERGDKAADEAAWALIQDHLRRAREASDSPGDA